MLPVHLLIVLLTGACQATGKTPGAPDGQSGPDRKYKTHTKGAVAARSLLPAHLGTGVTLKCVPPPGASYLAWYQQPAGGSPRLVSSYYTSVSNVFYGKFHNNSRFSLDPEEGAYHLKISDARRADSAMYYCATINTNLITFTSGIFLFFKESHSRPALRQLLDQSIQPGHVGTLDCSVHPGICDGECSVHWLRQNDQGDFRLGVMYAHGDASGLCPRSPPPESPQRSCSVYGPSAPATSSCVVASCGEVLFGNGGRAPVRESHDSRLASLCSLGAALAASIVLNTVLARVLYRRSRRMRLLPRGGTQAAQLSGPTAPADISEDEDADRLQYIALNFKKNAAARRRRSTEEKDTIYSGLRCQIVN